MAACVSASAIVMLSGGSLNQTIGTLSARRAGVRPPSSDGTCCVEFARVGLKRFECRKVLHLRHPERLRAIANRPKERVLHEMDVVQPLMDRLVVARRGVSADRSPEFGVGPGLMRVEIVQPVSSCRAQMIFAVVMICAECRCACSAA